MNFRTEPNRRDKTSSTCYRPAQRPTPCPRPLNLQSAICNPLIGYRSLTAPHLHHLSFIVHHSSFRRPAPRQLDGTAMEQCRRQNPAFSVLPDQTLFHRFAIYFRTPRATSIATHL